MNRNGKVALAVLGVLGAAFTLAVIGLVVFLFTRQASQPANDEEVITALFWEMRAEASEIRKQVNRGYEILDIVIEDEWATLEYGGVYLDTGEPVAAGPGLMIFREVNDRWRGEDSGSPQFKEWVEEIPESLIQPETKDYLR